ncbi:MAG TPA: hypothetical protein VIJ46_04335, partial [Rhabdochlamydiaceae bacterium]
APVRQPPPAARPAAPKGPPADHIGEFFNRHPVYHTEIAGMLADTPPGGNSPAWVAAAEQLSKKYPAITNAVIRQFKRKPTSDQAAEALLSFAGALRVTLTDFVEALSNSGNAEAARLICDYAGLPYDGSWIAQPAADCGASAKPAAPLPPLSPAAAKPAAPLPPLSPAAAKSEAWEQLVKQQQAIFNTIPAKLAAAPINKPAASAAVAAAGQEKPMCSICLGEPGEFDGDKQIKLEYALSCGHVYCNICYEKELKELKECACCKKPITNVLRLFFS